VLLFALMASVLVFVLVFALVQFAQALALRLRALWFDHQWLLCLSCQRVSSLQCSSWKCSSLVSGSRLVVFGVFELALPADPVRSARGHHPQ